MSAIGAVAPLTEIAAGAAERDRAPRPAFPEDAIATLERAGLLAFNCGVERPPAADELALVRGVACADASVGRILDGHLNAIERLAVAAPSAVRDDDLAAVAEGRLRAGVWGSDPRPDEGEPAFVADGRLHGVKTFCSGAGGLQRALVLARAGEAKVSAWVDLTVADTVAVDEDWYRSSGLRASVSHRVVFSGAPVLAVLGPLTLQPYFARDALRTAASWAGIADAAAQAALAALRAGGELDALAAARVVTESTTIGLWVDEAARRMDAPGDDLAAFAVDARAAIADAARRLLGVAAAAAGSHPFATGGALDRARRDLELFLLQHRLDPLMARRGAALLSR